MIYTQFGVPVQLTAKTANGSHVFVEAIEGEWNAWRSLCDLKADDGSSELQTAFEKAESREMPPEPHWKKRLRGSL